MCTELTRKRTFSKLTRVNIYDLLIKTLSSSGQRDAGNVPGPVQTLLNGVPR